MGLRVWLPLNGDLTNLGLDPVVATNNGATIDNNGKIGKCYSFDGSDDYIIGSPAPLTNNSQEWSFTCWFKPNISHQGCLFSNRTSVNSTGITIFYYTSQFYIDDGSRWQVTPSTAVTVGAWNHLAVVRKAGAYKKLYLNGVLINETTTTGTPTTATTSTFSIGASQTSPTAASGNQFNGYLNDVRIYDHCLSPLEIKEISQGLVLHYKLNNFTNFTDLINDSASWTLYNNLGQAKLPCTMTKLTDKFHGSFIRRTTYTPTSESIAQVRGGGLGSRGVYNWRYTFKANTKYVFWLYYKIISNHHDTRVGGTASNISGWYEIPPKYVGDGWYRVGQYRNGTVTSDKTDNIFESFYTPSAQIGDNIIIDWASAHLLEGTTEIPSWDYTSNEIVDCSGYGNNGLLNNITFSNEGARYNASAIFNGSNSYIKVVDNNWMVQGATAFTVNIWAKATTWPTNGGRIISCTESGGFNLEAGNSGYWRFPIHVYTNAALTSTTYQYDSNEIKISDLIPDEWNMITLVYDTTGTKTYINGVLNHTYTKASYGIHFNTNARMFLGCEASAANPSSPYFNGQESDFRFYYTALSAEDIKKLYEVSTNIDNFGKFHSYEFNENNFNLFESNSIKSFAKTGYSAGIGEIVSHNNYYAMDIRPAPFYQNLPDSKSGTLVNNFKANTSYLFNMWIDADEVIYNGNNVVAGFTIRYTDNSTDTTFNVLGGNKGYQHKICITPNNKTIQKLEIYYYTSLPVYYRLDSYIVPVDSLRINKNGILEGSILIEDSILAQLYKGGAIHSSNFIEI